MKEGKKTREEIKTKDRTKSGKNERENGRNK
jgi:hypothetical protein